MYWTADLRCRVCGYVETDRAIDAEGRDDALTVTFDCPSCDGVDTLEVVPETLRQRYVV